MRRCFKSLEGFGLGILYNAKRSTRLCDAYVNPFEEVTLAATLRSILNQSYANFSVKVYISKQPFLLDEGITEIPQSLKDLLEKFDNLSVIFCENLGPFRKLLPF